MSFRGKFLYKFYIISVVEEFLFALRALAFFAAEAIVFKGDPFVDTDIVLDLAVIAYEGIWADDAILADTAVPAYGASFHDVGEVPDACAFSDLAAFIQLCCGMDMYIVVSCFSCGSVNKGILLPMVVEGLLASVEDSKHKLFH